MEIELNEIGQYLLIRVNTKLDLYNIGEFKKILYDATSGKYTHLAVELKENNMEMDSSVISALISGQKKMNAGKNRFALLNVSQEIKNLFKLAGINDFFNFIDDEDQLFV